LRLRSCFLLSSTVRPRADDLQYRRPFDIARDDISVVCRADGRARHVDRQDGITHQRKCVGKQGGANEPGALSAIPFDAGGPIKRSIDILRLYIYIVLNGQNSRPRRLRSHFASEPLRFN
jgi:hypothetical protein